MKAAVIVFPGSTLVISTSVVWEKTGLEIILSTLMSHLLNTNFIFFNSFLGKRKKVKCWL